MIFYVWPIIDFRFQASEVVSTIQALESMISTKYMRFHSVKLQEIAQCLYEDESDKDLEEFSNKPAAEKYAKEIQTKQINAEVELKQEGIISIY